MPPRSADVTAAGVTAPIAAMIAVISSSFRGTAICLLLSFEQIRDAAVMLSTRAPHLTVNAVEGAAATGSTSPISTNTNEGEDIGAITYIVIVDLSGKKWGSKSKITL